MKRFNSTIKVKCKCSPDCEKVPTMSCYGYFYGHLPEDLKEKAGTKRKVAIKNRNKRVALSKNLHIAQKEANGDTLKAKLWFTLQRQLLPLKCACNCGSDTSKHDDKYFKFSCAHVLSKAKFKSIAWHPENCVGLSYFNGCHTLFDSMGYEYCKRKKPILWNIVVEKFKILYPLIANDELRNIPNVLLETLIPTLN